MIALHCDELSTTKHGWVQYGAVIFPAVVQQWCQLFSEDDQIEAMWQLAAEVIEATGGRKHWRSTAKCFSAACRVPRRDSNSPTRQSIAATTREQSSTCKV